MHIIKLLRPHQWIKNIFIFLPFFFGGHITNLSYWTPCIISFFAYSFAASAIYCLNDIWDIEADKLHPIKCKRPIASGKVSKSAGYIISLICIAISFGLIFLIGKKYLLYIITLYIVINIAYCIKLKQIALIDVFIIATGFVLRILMGGIATGVQLSQWIILMTFLLALFLAFSKRRDDVIIYENTGIKSRKNVNRYNLQFINQAISIVSSITMVCYIMYTVSDEVTMRMQTSYLYITSIFVLAGIMRYLQLTIVDIKSGSPTKVLMHDLFIQCCIIGWAITFFIILYY